MNYKDKYTSIQVIDDPTNGLVKLGLIDRVDSDRKSKITNNFVSQIGVLDPNVLKTVIKKLNDKLPLKTAGEKILGLQYSGVPMATALALERGSRFVFSTATNFGNIQDVFSFTEGHRNNSKYYFYGLEKGDSVIIIEDEVTSGKGMVDLIKALRIYNVDIVAVCTALETVTFGARDLIKNEIGIDLISLIKIDIN